MLVSCEGLSCSQRKKGDGYEYSVDGVVVPTKEKFCEACGHVFTWICPKQDDQKQESQTDNPDDNAGFSQSISLVVVIALAVLI